MARAIATEEGLGIEYDEQTVCDVCQDVSVYSVYIVCVCVFTVPFSPSMKVKRPMI